MPTLTLSKAYDTGQILDASDLTTWLTEVEVLLNDTKLNDDNIQDGGITGSSKLADSSISSDRLAASAITTAKIADSGISDDTVINASAVTTDKIAADGVTTAKIADSAITTAVIPDSSLSKAKVAFTDVGSEVDSAISTTTTEYTMTSVSITTNGRPVQLFLSPAQTTTYSTLNAAAGVSGMYVGTNITAVSATTLTNLLYLYRDATPLSYNSFTVIKETIGAGNAASNFPYVVAYLDQPAAGTYIYTLKMLSNSASVTAKAGYFKIYAREL